LTLPLAQAVAALERVPSPGLLLGLMLFFGIAFAYAARLVRIPRVIGYMLAGIMLKGLIVWYVRPAVVEHARTHPPYAEIVVQAGGALAQAQREADRPLATLSIISDLALGVILFTIGGVFESRHLRRVGARIGRLSAAEVGLTILAVFLTCGLVMLFVGSGGLAERFGLALLFGVAAAATAPAATLLVLQEYQAKGPTTDAMLTLVGLNNIASIVLFHVLFLLLCAAGAIETGPAPGRIVWLDLVVTTAGSVVLGLVVGVIISVAYARLPLGEALLIFIGFLLALGAGRDWLTNQWHLSFNFLLTCLFVGATFANVAMDPERFHTTLEAISLPLFAAFFVLAGYDLHVDQLRHLGLLGGVYVAFRVVGKVVGGWLGARWAGLGAEVKPALGLGMLCQAGVAIGLAKFLRESWGQVDPASGVFVPHELTNNFYTVILGSVVVFELVGPLLTRSVVVRAGEVKAIQLMRRPRAVAAEARSATGMILHALLRMLGLAGRVQGAPAEVLTTRHIMRTNVKLLRSSATFDEVLHFIERSPFNDFAVVNENDQLVGLINLADIRDIIYDPAVRELVTAVDLVEPDCPYALVDQPLTELLDQFHRVNVGCLPVVESPQSRKVVGMVEQRDLLRALHLTNQNTR